VNGWLWGATVLVAAFVAIEAAGVDAVLALLLISQGTNRQPFGDLALVLAVVAFVGTIAYLRFVEAFRDR
jgi:multisubunit Na+/H+ antiporter MnhF subunit